MMAVSMFEWPLGYAGAGYSVLPVSAGCGISAPKSIYREGVIWEVIFDDSFRRFLETGNVLRFLVLCLRSAHQGELTLRPLSHRSLQHFLRIMR
jgi:hypothetical protein